MAPERRASAPAGPTLGATVVPGPDAGDRSPAPVVAPTAGWRGGLQRWLRWESGLALLLIAVVILGMSVSSQFITSVNVFNLGLSNGEVAIMVLPMTLIVIAGEIDLSVASTLGLSSTMVGYLFARGWPMPEVIMAVLALGVVLGAFNGLAVTRLGLPSLAVTIGTLALYGGIAEIVLGPRIVSSFPAAYTAIGVNPVPHTDLSYSAVVFVVLVAIFAVVLHATGLGRRIYAIGANQEAALFAGIRVKRIKTGLFVLSGVVCSAAGILYTFRLSTAEYSNGAGLELSVVAIVLLGGVSIFGGTGSMLGVVLAVVVFSGIQNALLLTNFPQEATGLVTGGLLMASVLIPNGRELWRRVGTYLSRHRGLRLPGPGG